MDSEQFWEQQKVTLHPQHIPKIYELPDREDILALEGTPYFAYILLMAFAGLRAGEAVSIRKADIKRVGDRCFLDVGQSKQASGRIKEAKTQRQSVLPHWFMTCFKTVTTPRCLPNSLYKWLKRGDLSPHQLRHFYCTLVVRNTGNPELARRQLRHANLNTTLSIYAQVESGRGRKPCLEAL